MTDPTRNSFVALLDILGFKELVGNAKDLRHLAAKVGAVTSPIPRDGVNKIQFSDSVLLYTNGDDPVLLLRIVAEAADMIGENARRGIFMRAGISHGPFFRPEEGQIFLGKAMVRAYELEQQQDWFGGILDPALEDLPALDGIIHDLYDFSYLLRYEAPIKGGSAGEFHCIGWPIGFGSPQSLEIPSHLAWDARRKIANSNKFLRAYQNNYPGMLEFFSGEEKPATRKLERTK